MVKLVEMEDGEAMVELAKAVPQVVVRILVKIVVKRRFLAVPGGGGGAGGGSGGGIMLFCEGVNYITGFQF